MNHPHQGNDVIKWINEPHYTEGYHHQGDILLLSITDTTLYQAWFHTESDS